MTNDHFATLMDAILADDIGLVRATLPKVATGRCSYAAYYGLRNSDNRELCCALVHDSNARERKIASLIARDPITQKHATLMTNYDADAHSWDSVWEGDETLSEKLVRIGRNMVARAISIGVDARLILRKANKCSKMYGYSTHILYQFEVSKSVLKNILDRAIEIGAVNLIGFCIVKGLRFETIYFHIAQVEDEKIRDVFHRYLIDNANVRPMETHKEWICGCA